MVGVKSVREEALLEEEREGVASEKLHGGLAARGRNAEADFV